MIDIGIRPVGHTGTSMALAGFQGVCGSTNVPLRGSVNKGATH